MKFELAFNFDIVFHLLPVKPDHSCTCLCVQTFSDMFGFELFDYSSKYGEFNVLDHQPNTETKVGTVLAWAEVKPSKELLEWAGVFKRNEEKYRSNK